MTLPIIIDVTRLVARLLEGLIPSGIDRVSLEYVNYFQHQAYALVRVKTYWVILSKKDSFKIFCLLLSQREKKAHIYYLVIKNIINYRKFEKAWLLNTGHSGLHLPSYKKQLVKNYYNPIFFIHDLIPITHPEYCRAGEDKKHDSRLYTAIMYHKVIIVNSLDTKTKLLEYAEKNNLNKPNVSVNFLGTKIFFNKVSYSAPLYNDSYFVILGTIEARKNHNLLLYIWRYLAETKCKHIPRLVIIGRRGWECESTIDLLDRCQIIKPYILEINNCSDNQLSQWLSYAKALLFPSFVEGYGMPLAEAYTLGVPVIASNLAVYKEFAKNIPDYIDPLDTFKWCKYILDYTKPNSILRNQQLERLKSFQPPSWTDHFAKLETYLTVEYE